MFFDFLLLFILSYFGVVLHPHFRNDQPIIFCMDNTFNYELLSYSIHQGEFIRCFTGILMASELH